VPGLGEYPRIRAPRLASQSSGIGRLHPERSELRLKLTIKTRGQISKLFQKEITHYNEMNNKIFDIDMNVWDNARNVIELFSFHQFHGKSNSTIHIYI
jgi:hypothetical protein